jgi:poly(3-hydroxybutyrate) depolymerase
MWKLAVAGLATLALTSAGAATADAGVARPQVQTLRFHYRTHAGKRSYALLLLPAGYGPGHDPPIPLVICPHGRNTAPKAAAKRWYDLPTLGNFAVVLPAGQGRVLRLDSWGYPGQIADLARMPRIVERKVPFFRYRPGRVYGIGASMGAQEVLLLEATHPRLLEGAVAFDPAVNMATRYWAFRRDKFGSWAQAKARLEMGGTPKQVPGAYAVRSPTTYLRRIAFAGVPTQLWWSTRDQVILDQAAQTGRFFERLKRLNPDAPVVSYVGHWRHANEDTAFANLPAALARIGLLPRRWLSRDPLSVARGHPRAAAALAYTPQAVTES